MKRAAFRAVLFDLDGVIVDSMPYHFLSWYEAFRPLEVRMTCFDIYRREGESWEKTARELLSKSGIRPEPVLLERIFKRRKKLFRKYFKRHFFPGALELIERLKKEGVLLGLVTGTPLQDVRAIVPAANLAMFDAVVTGENSLPGKPHPAPYRKACRLLGVTPQESLVVENAPLGIESALRAGATVIAIASSLPPSYLGQAHAVVDDIIQASDVIHKKFVSAGR